MPPPPGPLLPVDPVPDLHRQERQRLIENLAVLVVRRHRQQQLETRGRAEPDDAPDQEPRPA